MNPFLDYVARPDAFPDFPALTPAAAEEALPLLLKQARERVDALEKTAEPDWDGFVRALDEAVRPLFAAWGLVGHLLSVCNSEAWRAVETKWQGELVAFGLRVEQSRRFYDLAVTLRARIRSGLPAGKSPAPREAVRLRILAKMIRSAELSGVALEGEKKARFNAISTELAQIGQTFRDHVLDATKAWRLPLDETQLAGVPEQIRAMVRGADGTYAATVEDAVYVPFMKHAKDRAVREKMCRARAARASAGTLDNTPLVDRFLALRRELAELLGFPDYATHSLATKCAPDVAAVQAMLDRLAEASRPAARRENDALAVFAAAEGGPGKLEPWDMAFYAERRREKLYSYSEEELSAYFDFPAVLKGLFGLAERLFGVRVEAADGLAPVWHPDVRFFRVCDGEGAPVAHFYVDPYSRPETKQGGAWMNEFRTRDVRPDGTRTLPLALICCNQALPDAKGRCRMNFREVETLFHEFGHALQQMLTQVDEAGASGLNLIDWDAVEVASQFMENWCYDIPTLARFAVHVETGSPLPKVLMEKVRAARNYRAGNACLRQVAFARTDMLLHTAGFAGSPDALKCRVFTECGVPYVPEDRFLNAFTHIFSGGYAAGYYGYKWSEVMSADVFAAFEEAGLDNEEAVRRVGRRYRETFLALGGSVDPMEVFRLFRGRAPTVDALLRHQELK